MNIRHTLVIGALVAGACKGKATIPQQEQTAVESLCADGVDNDDDGDLDCLDTDCTDDPACGGFMGTATGTGPGPGTGTGAATGTGTGSATGGPAAFLRVAHLIPETGQDVAVFLDDETETPLIEKLATGRGSDADGEDYTSIPEGTHDLSVVADRNRTIELLAIEGTDWPAGSFSTVLLFGNPELGRLDPDLDTDALIVDDDLSPASAGEHRLTVFHVNPWRADPIGVLVDGTPQPALYGEALTIVTDAGPTRLDLDLNTDGSADLVFGLELTDGGWSYAYLFPYDRDGRGAPEAFRILHHVRGEAITAALPQ